MLDSVMIAWRARLAKDSILFAYLCTTRAIYDRVAIVSDSSDKIFVEFPRKKFSSGKVIWWIVRDIIPKKEVVNGFYYK